jgi:recombination protein U
MNDGKAFEQDFIKSVPDDWFKYRLNDSASSWQGGDKARFTPSNICDFIVYNERLWLLELKSHKGKSIPLSCIRPKQVEGLLKAYLKGVEAGYVFNFRDVEETYYINANLINSFLTTNDRKSIPITWLREVGHLIPQVKKRVRYGYILEFMEG